VKPAACRLWAFGGAHLSDRHIEGRSIGIATGTVRILISLQERV